MELYMKRNIKRGLCLSGGGSHGAYQVGVLKALSESGRSWDYVSGVSVGSINGIFIAMHKPEEQKKAQMALAKLNNAEEVMSILQKAGVFN
jgi:predicted acylesterase/phospholipase RssA